MAAVHYSRFSLSWTVAVRASKHLIDYPLLKYFSLPWQEITDGNLCLWDSRNSLNNCPPIKRSSREEVEASQRHPSFLFLIKNNKIMKSSLYTEPPDPLRVYGFKEICLVFFDKWSDLWVLKSSCFVQTWMIAVTLLSD